MIFEQIVTRDLGCASYLVGCQQVGEAVVVDPPLDVAPVLEACERHGARLVGVIETHNHADHVSGHGVLAERLGVWIAIHEEAGAAYPHRALADGDRVDVGNIRLEVLHTPGHRPEHCCLAVIDRTRAEEPWLLLTGDSLFVGDVARPDLAVGGDEGAAALYRSLHERLGGLSDGVEVFPGHVAGSLCGRGMSAKTSTTLGFERRFNPMLAPMGAQRFVDEANASLAPKPPTMARVVEVNRGPLVPEAPPLAVVEAVPPGAVLLDVRDAEDFADGHVPGVLNVPASESGFATRAGFLLSVDDEIVLVADDERRAGAAARALAAVGFTRLARLAGGPDALELGSRFRPLSVRDLAASHEPIQIVDVREPDEQDVVAPGALAVPYRLLREADLSSLDPDAPVATICQSGVRSAVAASLLEQRGFSDVHPVLGGGMGQWPASAAAR